jgi:hypothetical protein
MNGMQRGGSGERSWAVEQLGPLLRIGTTAQKGSLEPLISCATGKTEHRNDGPRLCWLCWLFYYCCRRVDDAVNGSLLTGADWKYNMSSTGDST